ncbi:glutamine amidotransferase-related protein [Candidatus Sororendozoicomonas aggregata]|uniref:glutamine amidotransferase-related protein n=1 Tax=Candidatus Sororendozoicomonas aggregata TaxID=3073239 RepID=UPI002ED1063C
MRLGILACDTVSPEVAHLYPSYPDQFKTLFRQVTQAFTLDVFPVYKGQFPPTINTCDAYLITGSKFGVYDDLPWIPRLERFIQQLCYEKHKLIGICFGHQLIAQALGGKVIKSPKGWGAGLSYNNVIVTKPWMRPGRGTLALYVMHQDQVSTPPAQAIVIARSDFCPYFILQYGDHCLSIQGHPEFDTNYVEGLIKKRKGSVIPEDVANQGLASLSKPAERVLMAQWIVQFLHL